MRDVTIAITAASYSGNKGAAAMLQSSIRQLHEYYGDRLQINLMSVYPGEDREQLPFDFINVVPCKPEQLLFAAFPMAIAHRLLGWCPPVRNLLERNKILKAYKNTDLVIDEAGISFVDSRGIVMNTYAFVCAAVPLLMKVPVVKYSQAMGPFKNPVNRTLAKWILPKLKLICARGEVTRENLQGIGITDNVKLCADGAFTMQDDPEWSRKVDEVCRSDEEFFNGNVVGISLSSVVEKKCRKMKIDYKKIMVEFINYLNDSGYHVLLIANAARIHSTKPRNNDLMVCDDIYNCVARKDQVRWYHKEMDAEEIREYISRCRFLVASRFHAMIGALEKEIPVLLVGWSHKYQEVLDMFGLGRYAIDFSNLDAGLMKQAFEDFVNEEETVRRQLAQNHDAVLDSSRNNIRYICAAADEILASQKRKGMFDYTNPDKYMGTNICCRKGYSASEEIRQNAASGGMVTALLCHMLETGAIDGAWVTKSRIHDGKLDYHTFIATTKEEIMSASSSIYMEMPLMKHMDMVRSFDGKLAVVLTPCMMRAFNAALEKDEALKNRVVMKIGLFCSGNYSEKATTLPLEKLKISLDHAVRLYYRRGHWRGIASVLYENGEEARFSYPKTICAYKNAGFFEKKSCMYCQDHFASGADISVGDIWLSSMKKDSHKHTCCIIRTEQAKAYYQDAVNAGKIVDSSISRRDVLRGQKRALVTKFHCAAAKKNDKLDVSEKCGWNHRLAYFLLEHDRRFSEEHEAVLRKIPMKLIYYYMCFIRVLLSF